MPQVDGTVAAAGGGLDDEDTCLMQVACPHVRITSDSAEKITFSNANCVVDLYLRSEEKWWRRNWLLTPDGIPHERLQ